MCTHVYSRHDEIIFFLWEAVFVTAVIVIWLFGQWGEEGKEEDLMTSGSNIDQGWQTTAHRPYLALCLFLYAPQAKNSFYKEE